MTDRKQVQVYLTSEQIAALEAVVTARFGRAKFIREAIGKAVEEAGGNWPDNMPNIWEHMQPPPKNGG